MTLPPLYIDFETRSTVDLRATGVYSYATHPTTEILCMAYAFGDEDVSIWLRGERTPARIIQHIIEGGALFAHNAQFERLIWQHKMHSMVPRLEQWHCTAAEAAAMSLPRSLDQLAKVLGLGVQKDAEGHRVMMQVARPRRIEGDGTVVWWEDEVRMGKLYAYCKMDVEVERQAHKRLRRLSPAEREVYLLDQQINDRGVLIDVPLVHAATRLTDQAISEANDRLETATQGQVGAVTQVGNLLDWVRNQAIDTPDLTKGTVRDLLEREDLPEHVRTVLQIRQDAGRSSTAKLKAMLNVADAVDSRARGLLLYHGASTGRWSGKLIQPQNFPRGEVKGVEEYIPILLEGSRARLDEILRGGTPPLAIAAALLRSMLIAAPGTRLMAADFSQIEARVLGWIANEPYGDREYEKMAAAIYGVPVDQIANPSEERHIGKGTVLGAGYQMGAPKFRTQIAAQTGIQLTEEMAERAITTFRTTKPGIPLFWRGIQDAAMNAVRDPGSVHFADTMGRIAFTHRGAYLWCVLPSKRVLAYPNPRIVARVAPWGDLVDGLQCMGVNSMTKKWEPQHLYGGLLTENVVQAMSRDLMAHAMLMLERRGYPVILTVHDEVVCEVPTGHGTLEEFLSIMSTTPTWADGLSVAVEGWEGPRYRK